ncbi:hypothetical protein G7062_08960 [Erysipelothrix sp. HDW6C]|uniref:hypothetical protein n=1 Tax=Erysipelothrix sp. HDW6C TaxID=2714930 RepID=UPI00140D45F2|nr:hypothetical protein [Erysipelothrix sp. HDW6C]QIK70421.1 hypothetical protein G7062_08960 [Erysipelothrix sp. HDW6C]
MKKLILSLTLILLITGCSFGDRSLANERAKRYETNWESILDTEKFATKSNYFDVHTEISQSGDIYNYEITIDNPQIAMYEVEVIVIENNAPFTTEKMMPSAGIFEGQYTMIPNQSRLEKGFVGESSLMGKLVNQPLI